MDPVCWFFFVFFFHSLGAMLCSLAQQRVGMDHTVYFDK
jgi:hypothetical protein